MGPRAKMGGCACVPLSVNACVLELSSIASSGFITIYMSCLESVYAHAYGHDGEYAHQCVHLYVYFMQVSRLRQWCWLWEALMPSSRRRSAVLVRCVNMYIFWLCAHVHPRLCIRDMHVIFLAYKSCMCTSMHQIQTYFRPPPP